MRVSFLIICVLLTSCVEATHVSVQFVAPCDQPELLRDLTEMRIGGEVFNVRESHVGSLRNVDPEREKTLWVQANSTQGSLVARFASPFVAPESKNKGARILLAAPNQFVSAPAVAGKCLAIQNASSSATLLGYSVTYVPSVNKVLIIGGVLRERDQQDQYLKSVQSFEPDTGALIQLPSLKIGRAFHVAIASASGRVLIGGGRGEIVDQVREIRPGVIIDMNTPSPTYDETFMLLPRAFHRVTPLNKESTKVILSGGCSKSCDLSAGSWPIDTAFDAGSAIELVDLDTKTRVVSEHALASGRVLHGASVIRDRFLVVSGGLGKEGILSSVEVYDLQKESAVRDLQFAKLEVPIAQHVQVTTSDKQNVLLIGGSTDFENGQFSAPTDRISQWNPRDGEHAFGLRLPCARATQEAIEMKDGSLILLGGVSDKSYSAEHLTLNATYPRSASVGANFDIAAYAIAGAALPDGRAVLALGHSMTNASQIKMLTLE